MLFFFGSDAWGMDNPLHTNEIRTVSRPYGYAFGPSKFLDRVAKPMRPEPGSRREGANWQEGCLVVGWIISDVLVCVVRVNNG